MRLFGKSGDTVVFRRTGNCAVLTSCRADAQTYEIPETYDGVPVTEIAAGAFRSAKMKYILAGKNIRKIGKKAFAGCHKDLSVIIPENAERDEGSLIGCKSVYFETQDGLKLVSYSGHEEHITLESSCFSRKVIALGEKLFYMFAYMKSIHLPEFLTGIGRECFAGCEDLVKIEFPESLREIGAGAFSKSGLVSAVFPRGLKLVGNYAFLGCKDLAEADFQGADTEIRVGAFAKCGLTKVRLPEALTEIQSEAFRENKSLTEIRLPDTLEAVWEYAFADSGLKSVSLPDNVEVIGEGAFSGMPALTRIRLSGRMREIGGGAFAFSDQLRLIDTGFSPFRFENGLLTDACGKRLIAAIGALTKETLALPDEIEEISDYALAGNHSVKHLTLGPNVGKIGAWAMRDMGKIDVLECKAKMPHFGENPFFDTVIHTVIADSQTEAVIHNIIFQ